MRAAAWGVDAQEHPELTEALRDGHEAHAVHLGVAFDGRLAGVARLCVHARVVDLPDQDLLAGLPSRHGPAGPIGYFSRLAVVPGARGRGAARALDLARVELAQRAGCGVVLIVAREGRWRGLSRLGFLPCAVVDPAAIPDWRSPEEARHVMQLLLVRASGPTVRAG